MCFTLHSGLHLAIHLKASNEFRNNTFCHTMCICTCAVRVSFCHATYIKLPNRPFAPRKFYSAFDYTYMMFEIFLCLCARKSALNGTDARQVYAVRSAYLLYKTGSVLYHIYN